MWLSLSRWRPTHVMAAWATYWVGAREARSAQKPRTPVPDEREPVAWP
jgi:hypothetical protein